MKDKQKQKQNLIDTRKLLTQLTACEEAMQWACDKSWEEIYNTCHRGDWLLWLFARTNPDDLQLLTLVGGHCANTVRHLMTDQRSIAAVDAAIAFGEGKIGRDELDAAYADARVATASAFASAYAAAVPPTAFAASAASAAALASAYAAAADAADASYSAVYVAADGAKKENQKLTADIVRKHIPIEKFNI